MKGTVGLESLHLPPGQRRGVEEINGTRKEAKLSRAERSRLRTLNDQSLSLCIHYLESLPEWGKGVGWEGKTPALFLAQKVGIKYSRGQG